MRRLKGNYGKKVLLLAVCQGLMMTGNSLLIASSALIGLLLAANKALATLPLALQFLATMLISAPASLLMDRIGRRRGFMLGSGLGICGAAAGTLAILQGSFPAFCAATALIGGFNGFANYYRFAAADGLESDYRSRAISLVLAGGVIAAFIGPTLANWTRNLLEPAFFAGSLGSLVGVYALSLILNSLLPDETPEPVAGAPRIARRLRDIALQPTFIAAVLCGTLGYAIMTFIMTATPLAMQAHDHLFSDTAFVIQWHIFAMFAPSFVAGSLMRRFGVLRIMLIGAVLDALCVMINLLGTDVWHFWGALVLLGVGWNFLFVGASTLIAEFQSTEERAKTQAMNDFSVFTMVAIASLSAGALQHEFGWKGVNIGAIPVIAAVGAIVLWRMQRAPRTAG